MRIQLNPQNVTTLRRQAELVCEKATRAKLLGNAGHELLNFHTMLTNETNAISVHEASGAALMGKIRLTIMQVDCSPETHG